jgi:molybdate transport system ATP-binding protein
MIEIKGLNLEFQNFALKNIDLEIRSGEYFLLVGPTGAGKTLLLETIAGLHRIKSGTITVDGDNITPLAPEKRDFGMVYQDCALFPHLSVAENIAFGIKVKARKKQDLDSIVSLLDIGHLLMRKPGKLSGGEKQKVALARALAIRPRLLLLDEPLSALDPETREGLRNELKKIHRQTAVTIIHVTHDFDEALTLADRIAVMGLGCVRQVGTPDDIFHRPNSEFVARFTMMRNILPGSLAPTGVFRSGVLEIPVNYNNIMASYACIRPEDILLSPDDSRQGGPNCFAGTITRIEDRGAAYLVTVTVPPELTCLVGRREYKGAGLAIGQKIKITLSSDYIHVF